MTTAPRIEHQIEAYLSNEDSADIGNPIHSSEVAAQFGFRGALVGGGDGVGLGDADDPRGVG